MQNLKVHHIGYIIKKIKRAIKLFSDLGYDAVMEPVFDPYRKINICLMKNGNTVVELIESASPDSAVAGLLRKNGAMPYHICYETTCLEEAITELKAYHFILTAKPMPAPALGGGGKRAAFLYHAQVGLIELLEKS